MFDIHPQWHSEMKGRKPMFEKPELLDRVFGYAADGLNQAQIALIMGVHPNTFSKWKKRYPEIDEALEQGKELLIGKVENALVKRALGFRTVTDKQIVSFYHNGENEKHTKKVIRHISVEKDVAPDLAAIRTLLAYLGKKLEKDPNSENDDRIAYFLQGLREPDDSHGGEESSGDTDEIEEDANDDDAPQGAGPEAAKRAIKKPFLPQEDEMAEKPGKKYPFYP
ncbi:MAG: hypothetical protein A2Y33_04225 [Spirochaetes bacterium GWF1_51_8]|nr:MAG: hypothetical protein A2Y33_04225 [Spirochaetes bacterium GWF1_51_8]